MAEITQSRARDILHWLDDRLAEPEEVWAIGELQRELMKTLERPCGGDVGIKG